MQINLEVVSVGSKNKEPKYSWFELVYRNNDSGKVETKKLFDFAYPLVYKTFSTATVGTNYSVTAEKDDKYWNWVSVSGGGSMNAAPEKSTAEPAAKAYVKGSNYETTEERAARQTSIIRQSSLSNAIATLKTDKTVPTRDDVLSLAADYEQWVTRKTMAEHLEQFDDKLPD
jgi:hypothetical protein